MKKITLLIPLLLALFSTGCASIGPTVLIETPEPAEDFVVLCQWYVDPIFQLHGGGKLSKQNVYIAKSGEKTDCGVSLNGGDPTVQVMHPIYTMPEKLERDGLTVFLYTKTVLDILNEQKSMFEAGYWDGRRNPGAEYARSLVGCGFGNKYFYYYSDVKKVDIEHFKNLYHEPILKCKEQVFPILNKYLAHTYRGERPTPEKSMEKLWESIGWIKYQ